MSEPLRRGGPVAAPRDREPLLEGIAFRGQEPEIRNRRSQTLNVEGGGSRVERWSKLGATLLREHPCLRAQGLESKF